MFRVIGQEKVRQRQRFFCLSQKKVLLWSMKIQCSPRKKLKQCFSAQWGCVDLAFMFLRFIYTYDLSVPFADHDNSRTSPAPVNSDAPVWLNSDWQVGPIIYFCFSPCRFNLWKLIISRWVAKRKIKPTREVVPRNFLGRRGGLMVSAVDSGRSGPGLSPGRGHCVVFLSKTLYSHSASLCPCV